MMERRYPQGQHRLLLPSQAHFHRLQLARRRRTTSQGHVLSEYISQIVMSKLNLPHPSIATEHSAMRLASAYILDISL